MKKELLDYLVDGQAIEFQKDLTTFLNNNTNVEDLVNYAFVPSLLDSWLLSSQERLNFKLYKLFQPGKLAYDLTTYIIVPNTSSTAFIITLNNVYHRTDEAKNEIIQRKKLQPNQNINKRKSLTDTLYETVFKDYTELLRTKFSGTESERNAKAAWLLAQDRTHHALDRLANEKAIKYVGISNLKGVIDVRVDTNFHKIFKDISENAPPPKLINEIKNALQIRDDLFEYKTLQTAQLKSNQAANNHMLEFDKNFKRKLEFIIGPSRNTPKRDDFLEANLHGAVIGYLLARRRELGIKFKSKLLDDKNSRELLIFREKDSKSKLAQIVRLKVAQAELLNEEISKGLHQIDIKQYKYVFQYYNVLRVECVSIVADKFNTEILLQKKVGTIPLPSKNKHSFTKLLSEGSFDSLEHNINLFIQSVTDISTMNSKNPEFMPAFFLCILYEGVLQNNLRFYTDELSYNNYGFLIESVKKRQLILLTNAQNDDAVSAMLRKYDKQISSLSRSRTIPEIHILQLGVFNKEIAILVSKQKTLPLPHFGTNHPIFFQKSDFLLKENFASLLKNLIYKADQDRYEKELNKYIQLLFVENRKKIFPGQSNGEIFMRAGILGIIAASWDNLYGLELAGRSGENEDNYLCVTPLAEGRKRKHMHELSPKSLAFKFKWDKTANAEYLKVIADIESDNHIKPDKKNYLKTISKNIFYDREALSVVVAASETNVVTRVTKTKIIPTLPEDNFSLPAKRCRHRRAIDSITCMADVVREKKEIHKALKEIINLSDSDVFFPMIEKELFKQLRKQGIDQSLLNIFQKKSHHQYNLFNDIFLENHYQYLTGDSEEFFLRQEKSKINLKLKQWFSIVTFYNLFDGGISFNRIDGFAERVFISADLFETMNFYLGQRFNDYKRTRPLGHFFQKLASNPIVHFISYIGSIVQFGYGSYLMGTNQAEFDTPYWAMRGLHQSLAAFSRTLAQAHFPMFYMDILLSVISHIHSMRVIRHSYSRFLVLSNRQASEIMFKYLFGMDLSHYDTKIGFRQQYSLLADYLKQLLSRTRFRAAVFYADTITKHQLFVADKVQLLGAMHDWNRQTITYNLIEGSKRADALFNLTDFSIERFLLFHDAYLGMPAGTQDCLNFYSVQCINPRSEFSRILDDYHNGYSQERVLSLSCQLINGNSPTGSYCEKYQQILQDRIKRSIKVIYGADAVLPTQLQTENRFQWISVPLGELKYSHNECLISSVNKKCNDTYVFEKSPPFILVDTLKQANDSILYINAPSPTLENITTTRLQVLARNPAVIFVSGDYVTYNGSEKGNHFILQHSSKLHGYLRGGSANDSIQIDNLSGTLSLRFTDKLTTIGNKTNQILEGVDIESYVGGDNVTETIEIDYCGLRLIDAKGNSKANNTDKFIVNNALRCQEHDKEYRMVYAGDVHHLASHKPIIFRLTSIDFVRPAFFIQSIIPSVYSQIVLLDLPLKNLTISNLKVVEATLPGEAYEIKTMHGSILVKSNAYVNLIYQTQEGIQFYLKKRTLMELQQSIVQHKLYNNTLLKSVWEFKRQLIHTRAEEDINIVANYKNLAHRQSRRDLQALMLDINLHFIWQLQRFAIDDSPFRILEWGSIYNDVFSTAFLDLTYEFTGGEGTDFYNILPSEECSPFTDNIFINNEAFLYDEYHGQDILDLSTFEYLSPALNLTEIDATEIFIFGVTNKTIVLEMEYDCSPTPEDKPPIERGKVRICLQDYVSHERFRHLLVKLSHYAGSDVLYRIDLENKQLIPIRFYQSIVTDSPTNTTSDVTDFPAIPLNGTQINYHIWEEVVAHSHTHPLHHNILAPKIKALVAEEQSKENSYFPVLVWGSAALLFSSATIGLILSRLRTSPAVTYAPVNLHPIPSASTLLATAAASNALLDSVAATFTMPPINYWSDFKAHSLQGHEKYPLQFTNVNTEEKVSFSMGSEGFTTVKSYNLSFIAEFFGELYRKKREQQFIKVDFARKAIISQLQSRQIQIKSKEFIDSFVRAVNDIFKLQTTIPLSDLALKIAKLANKGFEDSINVTVSQDKLTEKITTILQETEPASRLARFLVNLFYAKVSKQIKGLKFSGIEEVAEHQKKVMLKVLPIILQTEDAFINSYANKIKANKDNKNNNFGYVATFFYGLFSYATESKNISSEKCNYMRKMTKV